MRQRWATTQAARGTAAGVWNRAATGGARLQQRGAERGSEGGESTSNAGHGPGLTPPALVADGVGPRGLGVGVRVGLEGVFVFNSKSK